VLHGKRILLGVSGGIAAYKACELARLLKREGAEVHAVLTPRAAQFVTPLTFAALTGYPVLADEFPTPGAAPQGDVYAHLNLPRGIDCFVLAPASATTLARLAGGSAETLLSACYLATLAPVVIAPAMNVRMWQHPAVQANVELLRQRGGVIVEPGVGELACGDSGGGRLAELPDIFSAVVQACSGGSASGAGGSAREHSQAGTAARPTQGALAGKRIIVTAGGTREYLDPVRFITNASTGALGVAVAAEVARRGAKVELVDSGIDLPSAIEAQLASRSVVRTAFDLQAELARRMAKADGLVMLAAVADYGPAYYTQHKRKKDGAAWSLELAETVDVLKSIAAQRRPGQLLAGVSLEDSAWLERAQGKCASKGVDMMVAVELGADIPVGERRLNCALVSADAVLQPAQERSKAEVAGLIAGWLEAQWGKA
jgi:phosphopantothenoylcysteine decarboxylase / phosphopantothenate---cysteine ligase